MAPEAREIAVGDEPAAWARLGFALGPGGAIALAGVRVLPVGRGEGIVHVAVHGLEAERPDGLAIVRHAPSESLHRPALVGPSYRPAGAPHPNGALAVDHVVALTDDLDRTLAALERAGLELRRLREPPEAPARQAFLRLGPLILELVETGGGAPALWGLVVVVADLDACARQLGALLGRPRDAVQPGRRIATVRSAAGLTTALALMTPRPQPGPLT